MSVMREQLKILTLEVVKSSLVITRGWGNVGIVVPSIRCADFCEIDVLPPATSFMLPIVSTIVGSCNGSVLSKNILYRGGGGWVLVKTRNTMIFYTYPHSLVSSRIFSQYESHSSKTILSVDAVFFASSSLQDNLMPILDISTFGDPSCSRKLPLVSSSII